MSQRVCRWVGTLGALIMAPAPALAWQTTSSMDLDTTVNAIAVLPGTTPHLIVVGPSHTWLVDPKTGDILANKPVGGESVAGADGTVWLCGQAGLQRLAVNDGTLSDPVVIDTKPCRAVSQFVMEGSSRLLVVRGKPTVYDIGDQQILKVVKELDKQVTGWPLIATDKRRFAIAGIDDTSVIEEGPWGTSTLAAGGKLGGLTTSTASWIWSLPSQDALVDVTRRRIEVAAAPGPLASADVDGDGKIDVLVSHPTLERLGIVRGGSTNEVLIQVPAGVRAITTANLDRDPCAEVALITASGGVRVLDGTCGGQANKGTAETDTRSGTLVIGETWPTVTMKVGERLDLKLHDQLGQASAWAASGGPDGLIVTSTGDTLYRAQEQHIGRWRISVRLWADGAWKRRSGFELIVKPGDPDAPPQIRTGVPVRTPVRRQHTDLTKELKEEVGQVRRALPLRGCNLGVGGVIGVSKVTSSWIMLGEDYVLSASPALSLGCEGAITTKAWWSAGLDMAPWFVYLVEDTEMRHGIAATVGFGVSAREDLRIGVYGTVGSTILGVGALGRWMPFHRKSGARHGPEVRLTWMPSNGLIVEGGLYYNVQLGSFRKPVARVSPVPGAKAE